MLRTALLGISLALAAATPIVAQETPDKAVLERRLRACLVAGSAGAPRDSLMAAILALRSLCYTQINRVEDVRLREVDESFGLPAARLSAAEQARLERERDLARRRLNHEIGMAVSNFTGLSQ